MDEKFSQKLKTFALRSYWNFWNSDSSAEAYKALFKLGLSDKTMQDFAMGWNNKKSKKDASSFGLEKGVIEIPLGIVLPHLIEKKVVGIRIYSSRFEEILRLPHSIFPPLVFDNDKKITLVFTSVFDFLLSVQNLSDKANLVLLEDINPSENLEILKESGFILFEKTLESLIPVFIDKKYDLFSDYGECVRYLTEH